MSKDMYTTLKRAAERKFEQAKRQDEPGMMAMYAADSRDMFEIARMIKDGDYAAAKSKARHMDTAARDEIPLKVWEFLWNQTGG